MYFPYSHSRIQILTGGGQFYALTKEVFKTFKSMYSKWLFLPLHSNVSKIVGNIYPKRFYCKLDTFLSKDMEEKKLGVLTSIDTRVCTRYTVNSTFCSYVLENLYTVQLTFYCIQTYICTETLFVVKYGAAVMFTT